MLLCIERQNTQKMAELLRVTINMTNADACRIIMLTEQRTLDIIMLCKIHRFKRNMNFNNAELGSMKSVWSPILSADDKFAASLKGKFGAEIANINSVSVNDIVDDFYSLSK